MRIVGLVALPLLLATVASGVLAQTLAPPAPTFDVVSIKRNMSEMGPGYRSNVVTWRPDGGVTMTNSPVGNIIAAAYPGTIPADIEGLPAWSRDEHFDVRATSSLSRATPDDRVAMLRAMLADRFKLRLHVENRDEPVYDLVLARSDGRLGAGMSPTEIDCAAQIAAERAAAEAAFAAGTPPATRPPFDRNAPAPRCALRVVYNRMEGDTTMANLASALRMYTGRHVVDKTGLTGYFKVTMVFDPLSARRGPDTAASDPNAPASIFTAVQEQFGMKLQSSHASGSRLVIDRLERPTPD